MCGFANVQMCEFVCKSVVQRIRIYAHSQIRTLISAIHIINPHYFPFFFNFSD